MVSKNWKNVEYKVARRIGGERNPVSGNARAFKGDVNHPDFFIEVKSGKQIPKIVFKWHQEFKFIKKIMGRDFQGFIVIDDFKIPKKIMGWYKKAQKDNSSNKKTLLIMKPKYCKDEYVLWKVAGSYLFTTLKIFAENANENNEYFKKAIKKYCGAIDRIKLVKGDGK